MLRRLYAMARVVRVALAMALVLGLTVGPVLAAVTATPVFVQTPRAYKLQLTNASGTGLTTLTAGGTNGTKVTGLWATSTDTASNTIIVSILRTGPVNYVQATITLPANSGNTAGTAAVNLMSPTNWPGLPTDSDGNPYFILESTDTLQIAVGTTITSGKLVSIVSNAGDF